LVPLPPLQQEIMMEDLELYNLILQALCKIPNKKLGFDKAKDTYELINLVENRVKEITTSNS